MPLRSYVYKRQRFVARIFETKLYLSLVPLSYGSWKTNQPVGLLEYGTDHALKPNQVFTDVRTVHMGRTTFCPLFKGVCTCMCRLKICEFSTVLF